ncbi:MAG: hypothetical protein Q7T74_04680 [Candidatus Saccharibacteria bacterium]|nr:hypothetical protein [Candidatus Saccharibacteria bacterium]
MKIFYNKKTDSNGFVLPTVLVLSVVLLTLGLSVFQLTSSIARSLTDQYWQRLAKQTSQAGVSYVSACVDQGLSPSTWPTLITQDTTCLGGSLSTSVPTVHSNYTDKNPGTGTLCTPNPTTCSPDTTPSPYKTTFTVKRPEIGADSIAKARIVGKVEFQSSAQKDITGKYIVSNGILLRNTVRTYTYETVIIVNGPTQAFTQISAGKKHVCALTDGRVYCWGSNAANPFAISPDTTDNTITGQLGIGSSAINVNKPSLVGGLLASKFVTSISSGSNFTCAIANGAVYCWGANNMGQLGNGNNTTSNVPVAVKADTGTLAGKRVTDISAGQDFACALSNGAVYCWGNGASGQHGNGTNNTTNIPDAAVSTIGRVSAISAGASHICAVDGGVAEAGAGYCWGNGTNGQLGDGATSSRTSPVKVYNTGVPSGTPSGRYVKKIYANKSYTCALAYGAEPYCWGYNSNGQLGNNSTTQQTITSPVTTNIVVSTPPPVTNVVGLMTDMTSSSSAEYHTCALANGNAFCWGKNDRGQIGNNSTTQALYPRAVDTSGLLPTDRTITAITTGGDFTCALAEGQPYCWGSGVAGQLGNGVDNTSCGCTNSQNLVPKKTINTYQ